MMALPINKEIEVEFTLHARCQHAGRCEYKKGVQIVHMLDYLTPMMKSKTGDSISRCFRVLETLGRHRSVRLIELVRETQLPQATVARYLKILTGLGYVAKVSRVDGYRLTDRFTALSGLVRFSDRLVDAARRPMSSFTRTHGWPLYLATSSVDSIRIRYSTARESPMDFEGEGINRKRSALTSAPVLVWIAYCSDEERQAMLQGVRDKKVHPRPKLLQMLADIRRRGFAFSIPDKPARIHGLAVPVMRDSRIIAAITMRFPRSVMTENVAATRCAPQLKRVAAAIAKAQASS